MQNNQNNGYFSIFWVKTSAWTKFGQYMKHTIVHFLKSSRGTTLK